MANPYDNQNVQYDMSNVDVTESDMKEVPPSLTFREDQTLFRSVLVAAPDVHHGMMDDGGLAEVDAEWGIQGFNDPSGLDSDSFLDTKSLSLGPGKLSSTDGFNPTKNSPGMMGAQTQAPYLQEVVQPRTLDPTPVYFEKYSSFTSTSLPQELLQDICKSFSAKTNVDFEPCLAKNKIKGVAYECSGRCSFKVRLYRGTVPGTALCEFQRRSGCVVSFNKFYRRCLADIAVHVRNNNEKQGSWLANLNRLEIQANEEPAVQLDTATASNLIAMAGCDCVDVQREGAQALVGVCQHAINQAKLCEMQDQVLPLLQKLLTSADVELCRSGCVLLSSIAGQEVLGQALAQQLCQAMCAVLDGPSSFERLDSKRQVVSALSLLSKSCPDKLQNTVPALKKFMHCEDASLKQPCLVALSNLQQ